jgi:hypothetical protein
MREDGSGGGAGGGSADRRRNRKIITRLDQELLNRVRSVCSEDGGSSRQVGAAEIGQLLGIREPELCTGVLRVLSRGRVDRLSEAEFRRSVVSLVLAEDTEKLRFVFDLHDGDGDGALGLGDLDGVLEASLRHNRVSLSPREKRDLSRVLLAQADRNGDGRVDFTEFHDLLDGFPLVRNDLAKSIGSWFHLEGERRKRRRSGPGLPPRLTHFFLGTLPFLASRYLLGLLYVGANAFLFWRAMSSYAAAGAPLQIQIARGAGACLNLNGALILLPVMRFWLTRLRRSTFGGLLPLDRHIDLHKLLGHVLLGFSLLHTGAHLVNYLSLGRPLTETLLASAAGLTGVALLAVFLVMWSLATAPVRRGRRFELFFFSHLLYLSWFVILLAHAPNFWKWALAPLALFAVELLVRRFRTFHLSYLRQARPLASRVTHLQLHRPEGFSFQPGDFLFVKIPALSRFEWHPFTISSAPEQADHLGLHVRGLGNWTNALHERVGALPEEQRRWPVMIHGPYGTPSNEIFRSRVAILVGAGIGVTPFASILRSLMNRRERELPMSLEKVYFYWLNSGRESFEWFTELLAGLEARGMSSFLELNMYLTGVKINATSGLMKIGMDLIGIRDQRDLTTGLKTITNFGRPDWEAIFGQLARRHGYGGAKVFFCGPYPLGQVVRSAAKSCGFRFRKENF